MVNIFEYKDYASYINDRLESSPNRGFGLKKTIAEIARCKTGYVSQILQGKSHFSLEQAYRLNDFFNHTEKESNYFILLVNFARSGSAELKSFFKKQITIEQNKSLQLKNKFQAAPALTEADLTKYYASIDNSLVHILTTIPEYQTKSALKEKLKFSYDKLDRILNLLITLGFVQKEKGEVFVCGKQRLHLPDDSPLIFIKHALWRLQALKSLQNSTEYDLHYSSVVSISKEDFMRIKQSLIKEIEKCTLIIKDSSEEIPCSFCLDFYEISQS